MNDNIMIYQTEDGLTKVDVKLDEDTVWLTLDQMSELFQKAKSTISEHISNIYDEGELERSDTMRKFGNSEFSTKPTNFYSLDVIISVGYRVKSLRGREKTGKVTGLSALSNRCEVIKNKASDLEASRILGDLLSETIVKEILKQMSPLGHIVERCGRSCHLYYTTIAVISQLYLRCT